jgi:outer membrane receptor protein involved in Fe transport
MKYLAGSIALLALAPVTAAHAAPAAPSGEVVVTAQKAQSQTLIDRKVYTVSGDVQAATASAAEVLNKVPSVTVDDDGNVTLRGDPNVTILIDGKPSAQFSGATRGASLLQLSADDIERVEVLTNPPAQYRAEGTAGVINIITKKTRKPGFSGGAQASLGDQRRYILGLNAAYNAGPLKLSGALGLRQDAKERLTPSVQDAGLVHSTETIDEHFRRLTPSAKFAVDYDLNRSQSLGASFSHREQTGARYFDQVDASGPDAAPPTSLTQRHSDGHEWNDDTSVGVHFDQKLARPGETVSLSLQQSGTHERERYFYTNTDSFAPPGAAPTYDDLHLDLNLLKTEFSADYDLPLKGDRELKLGYDIEDDHNGFDNIPRKFDPATGLPVSDPLATSHFRYNQQVNATYGQFEGPLGAWRLQVGLRLEAAHITDLQITGNVPGGRNDFGVYPSLHLDRPIGDDGKLFAGLSRRINRPDPEALNPFLDPQDTHNLRAGNPNLLPQDTWSYELGYNGGRKALTFSATLYYRFDRNSITDVTRLISPGVVLSTKTNLPKSQAEGLEFSANGTLARVFSYALSGDLFHAQIDATALGALGLRSTTGLNLKASFDYRPTAVDTAQISFTRTDKRLTPQGDVAAVNLVNLGYRRQLRPDLAAVLTMSDIFDRQRFVRHIDTPALRETLTRHQLGRIAYVGLVYTFGAVKKAKPSGFDYDQ